MKGLPRAVREALTKARDPALLAVEAHNKPAVTFKSAAYITLMVIAWTGGRGGKTMRGAAFITAIAWLLMPAAAAAAGEWRAETMIKPEEFAILPWGGTPGNLKALEEIRDCGFNLAGFVAPEHLGLVSEAGLKCIVSEPSTHVGDAEAALGDDEIAKRVQALTQRVGGHKAVFGYYLRDEPGAAAGHALDAGGGSRSGHRGSVHQGTAARYGLYHPGLPAACRKRKRAMYLRWRRERR
ncbi:MAG: DUF3644 domain-containing protein [Planctomycetota bacterium]